MSYTVYKHTSPSGKIYIGITGRKPRKRFDNGRGYAHCAHMQAAISKYGWENFQHEILQEGLTREEAEDEEKRLIAYYKSNDRRFGYNIAPGGRTSYMSEEGRQRIAERMKGDQNPTIKYGHPFEGRTHSTESKLRMSEAAKRRTRRPCSPELKQKLREAQKKKPVKDLETGQIYAGIHEAAEATGLDATKICAVCKGKRNKTGGKRWEYVKETEPWKN